ncbi:MAG: molybdopterin-dependent oxidoreductase, partial [Vicinamibacterales bacterium]
MRKPTAGGGLPAILYVLRKSRQGGGFLKTWRALRSKNTCKTCAVGMGGQRGGMVNERGQFPEVCKKSVQAMAADMQGAIPGQFWATHPVSQLRRSTPRELEHYGRLAQPVLYDGASDVYREVSWPTAMERIASTLRHVTPDESFWYFSGRSSNEAGFLLQLFARLYGTNNVNNCSYYCHQASGVGMASSLGTGTATVTLEDLERSDLVFVIGGNPASNHPRLMTTLMHLRRRGGHVVVINPLVETGLVRFRVPSDPRSLLFGSDIASLYVQPHIGGDLALLTGIAKRIVEMNAHDEPYLRAYCAGWDAWRRRLDSMTWEEIWTKSGVNRESIDAIAERYARSTHTVFAWTMGITHHVHGVQNVQAIANLALLRGMVGKPSAGLLPIRGHSNVQGIGTMGVTPQLTQAVFDGLQDRLAVRLPTAPGLDTLGCIEQAHAGRLKVGVCLGGNLFGSNPDAAFAAEALSRLDLLVYLSSTLYSGHAHGL